MFLVGPQSISNNFCNDWKKLCHLQSLEDFTILLSQKYCKTFGRFSEHIIAKNNSRQCRRTDCPSALKSSCVVDNKVSICRIMCVFYKLFPFGLLSVPRMRKTIWRFWYRNWFLWSGNNSHNWKEFLKSSAPEYFLKHILNSL